jgi:hypothetical protein
MALREEEHERRANGPVPQQAQPPALQGQQSQQHQQMVSQPPVQNPAWRALQSADEARRSVDGLVKWFSRASMGGLMGGEEGRNALNMISQAIAAEERKAPPSPELDYYARAIGHTEAPVFFATAYAARQFCQGLMQEQNNYLASIPPPPGVQPIPQPPVAGAMERFAGRDICGENERMGAELAGRMLDYGFFGPWVQGRFTTPQIVTPPPEFFSLNRECYGGNPSGLYYPGTNMIVVSPLEADQSTRREVMLHEMLHYSAFLGGGGQVIRWRDDRNQPVVKAVTWLDEGLTQFHTKEMLARHKENSPFISYASEVVAAQHLQRIAGAEPLRRAYLTGNFTEVREAVDKRLGKDTFLTLSSFARGSDALGYLRGRVAAVEGSPALFETGPVAEQCFMVIPRADAAVRRTA